METEFISETPGSVKRLGLSTFVIMNAYSMDPKRAQVVYVRNDLLKTTTGKTPTDAQAKAFVEQNLLLSLDPDDAIPGALPVKVYVDLQADPMNMSLNENLGSGRAVYVGSCFNIKGLGKTVLALSKDPIHSNGSLDLVSALWEMICSNALQSSMKTGTSPVLAVVDLKKPVKVPWYEPKIPSGLIIRMDDRGQLDRPTHLFQMNKPVPAIQIRHIAKCFGMQDAEKFIERILHGCWSAGNISLDGHLIDYDTVFALRGRAPQWSYRPNWLSDFFGLEGPGQKKLLKALVSHPLNTDRVSFREAFRIFDEARQNQLEQRFLDLVGAHTEDVGEHFPVQISTALVKQFELLSMKMYPNFKATAPWELDNSSLSVYDLSRFFRFYPILRDAGRIDEESLLSLIRNPAGRLKESSESGMPDSVLKPLIKKYVVSSPEQLQELDRQAMEFIKDYDALLSSIEKKLPGSFGGLIVRAYVVNEERTYMNSRPGNDILVALVQKSESGKIQSQRLSELLHLLVEANDRIPRYDAKGRCQADLRLFLNGYTSNLLDGDGFYQSRLTLLDTTFLTEAIRATFQGIPDHHPEHGPIEVLKTRQDADAGLQLVAHMAWEVEIAGNRFPCTVEQEMNRTHVIGPPLPLFHLLNEAVAPIFFCRGAVVNLEGIMREDRPAPSLGGAVKIGSSDIIKL
ncbi:MAG: hypothetical protein WA705_27580 [Candidatus Ozemobacteraceae bacterium]